MSHARWLVLAALVAALSAPAAPAPDLQTAEQIQECVRSNFPQETSLQTIELRSIDRGGGVRTLHAKLYWKRLGGEPRVLIRVERPPDLRDSAYLVIQKEGADEMFMYLPALRKVRRITSGMLSNQLWGTDFSYEDVKHIQGIATEGDRERLPDAEVAGRTSYVIATRPSDAERSSYTRIVSYVDRRTCTVLRTDLHERGEQVRKRLVADPESIEKADGRWMARRLEMRDLRDETRTQLRVLEVENDVEIPEVLFRPSYLKRGH